MLDGLRTYECGDGRMLVGVAQFGAVWCLGSGAAALPIRVHCDLNILIKVTIKLSTFKPKYMVEDLHLAMAMAAQHINIMAIFCTQQTNCILSLCR